MYIKSRAQTVAVVTLLLLIFGLATGHAQEIISQWVLSEIDASSEPLSTPGNLSQTIGPPNSNCELNPGESFEAAAWRPRTENDNEDEGVEWMEVRYLNPVHAFSIEIYESLNPGAVTGVFVLNDDGDWHQVWAGEDTTSACPGVLKIEFPSLPFVTSIVRIELNIGLVDGFNQIDAVQLIGFKGEDIEFFFAPLNPEAVEKPASMFAFTVADYDHDGWPDLFGIDLTQAADLDVDFPLLMLHNEGNGTFRDRTPILPVRNKNSSSGRIFADYDNDGDLDLFYGGGSIQLSTLTPDLLLRNDGGTFVNVAQEAGLTDSLITAAAIWWDYNLDGFLDLYVMHGDFHGVNTAANQLFRNNGDGTFTETTEEAGLDVDLHLPDSEFNAGSFTGATAADFNDDGWPDLYLPVQRAVSRLFLSDGQGGFRDVSNPEFGPPAESVAASIGDIDNDGDLDIFQAATAEEARQAKSRSILLLNRGGGDFLDITEGAGLPVLSLPFSHLKDFDNDGDVDLLTAFPFVLYMNNGEGVFEDGTFRGGLPGIFSMGDYDDDGFLDAWFSSGLFRNTGSDNHSLRINLVGTQSNRDGIGARVIATAGDLQQIREHSAGNGVSQNEMVVHFGLGEHTQVDQLEIRWPSGQVDIIDNIPADQEIRIIEGRGAWYPAPRTTWTVEPPKQVIFGGEVDFVAEMRPTLFEPTATITSITADLSSLGGPSAVPLADLGDGTCRLEHTFVVGEQSELRDVEIFILQETSVGKHWINFSRNIEVLGDPNTAVLEDFSASTPDALALAQNYPNPFNSSTVIRFTLPQSTAVELAVYNLTGQRVFTLVKGPRQAGNYAVHWDGRDYSGRNLASGTYIYHLRTEDREETRKLLLLR